MRRMLTCLFLLDCLIRVSAQAARPPEATADRAGTLIESGKTLLQKKDYVNALKYFEQARPLLEQQNDENRLGLLLKQMGDVHAARSYFRQAADTYRDAMVYLRKTGRYDLVGACWESLAEINASFGYTVRAIEHYDKALAVKTGLNDPPGMAKCHLLLSKLHFSQKNYETALSHNGEAQKLAGADWALETETAIREAVILTFLGRSASAEQSLKKADALVAAQNNPANRIRLLSAKYNFSLSQKNEKQAQVYLDSAKNLMRGSQNPELAIEALGQIAEIHKNNGDYEAAYLSMVSLDHYKNVFRKENVERIIAEINDSAGATLSRKEIELADRLRAAELSRERLARLALLRENVLKDSAFANQARLLEVLENESTLREAQLLREKQLSQSLSRENELKQQLLDDERRSRNLLFLGLAGMILLGGVIFFQYRKQQKNNRIIQKQSEELAVLNKEIHHRVKNNLQVISSMLDLQSQTLRDKKATGVIKEAILRIQSMAFIHQNLYRDNAVNSVNMTAYIQTLSDHLFKTYNIRTDKIQLHTQIEPLDLHTDTAIPLGMILNELISNALKYAFKNREQGDIWVVLKRSDQALWLQVKDNGVGLPEDFNPDRNNSFGYEIINAFAQKMRAKLHIDGSKGTDVQLLITKFKTTADA